MYSRLSVAKKHFLNKRYLSNAVLNTSHHYQNTKMKFQTYPATVMHYSQPAYRYLRMQAPVLVEELKDHDIEEMVAALTPLEKATLKIFNSGSMSYGSISLEAHTTLAEALNRINLAIHGVNSLQALKQLPQFHGPLSGSGEGGELTFRNDTLWQSLMRQIASGRFGVTSEYLALCSEIQIKIAQGAKPGVGGELPGKKVTLDVAFARLTKEGTTLVSPALNHDVSSIEDLKQLIHDLRSANPKAVISVKLVANDGIGVIAVGTAKCGADSISIAGPGGTGAATYPAKHEFTLPAETAIAESHQALIEEGLRDGVRLTMSGGIQTGEECFMALCLGADGIELGTEMLVALGCINAKLCHNDKCPTGIATNDQTLIDEKFKGKPEHVARILIELAKSTAAHIEKYGYDHPSQIIGHTEHLSVKPNAPVTGLEKLLYQPTNPYFSAKLEKSTGSSYLEQTVIWDIANGKSTFHLQASNTILSFGARIAFHTHENAAFKQAYFAKPIRITFNGVAMGQSFGFVAIKNMTLLVDNANDGTGKSLDGATIYVKQLAGNQTGYGATSGTIFVRATGDRAFVRNSGGNLVCEVMGEMGVNFMTGGTVTIFGAPNCYDGLDIKGKYKQPVSLRNDIVGFNFGASFTGGTVILPRKLYDSMYHHHYFASPADKMKPQCLSDAEVDDVYHSIQEYYKEIVNPFIEALLKCDKATLKLFFIKLSPDCTYDIAPERDASRPMLTLFQGITILPSKAIQKKTLYFPEKIQKTDTNIAHVKEKSGLHQPEREKDACGTGVLVNRKGNATRQMVLDVLKMLAGYMHRGATSADPFTSDGCGISFFGTDSFFAKKFSPLHLKKGNNGIIHIALPQQDECHANAKTLLMTLLQKENLVISGERDVVVNSSVLGYIGRKTEPQFQQFVIKKPSIVSQEEFEKQLIRVRLQFELLMQGELEENRPHILSASSYHVIYKSLVRENKLADYFLDLQDDDFVASASVAHSRFTTNTKPRFRNIQPLKFANNGENNALRLLINLLSKYPVFKSLLGMESIDLRELSDTHIMSIYMDLLHLMNYSLEEIVASTIQRYEPHDTHSSDFYNVFALPFEGPNTSIIMMNDKIVVVGDKNGYRPKHGIMNDDLVYLGSELGPVEMIGNNIDLPPAQPFMIDLEKNTVGICKQHPANEAFHQRQMEALLTCSPDFNRPHPIQFSEAELQLRKIWAGWTEELQAIFMQGNLLSSMGNQGPSEPFVRGAYHDIYAYFYGSFSQVTNPPLAIKEEKAYMSTRVFVGEKPALWELNDKLAKGYLLSTPIVDNHEMEYLKTSKVLNTHVVDCVFSINIETEKMELLIQKIAKECVKQVETGVTFLVLSDIQCDQYHAPLPPVILASIVHDALSKAGVRHKVALALQAGSLLTGREIAQAISIGGVDVINPYLAFISLVKKQCDAYKEFLRHELLSFMGRMGISTLSAYRGAKGFYSYGIDADLANTLELSSKLGGIGLKEIARMIIVWHKRPKHDGLGRYDLLQPEREGIWSNAGLVRKVAEGKGDWQLAEKKMNALKTGFPRGWLQLNPSPVWNRKNPMTIAIIGAGAAGLNVAKELLASGLPITITLYESQAVNPIGLIGNGVAPDHAGTKNVGKYLRDVFEDESRIKYRGGLVIGEQGDITLQELETKYACIIDCSGADTNRQLNVKGESLPAVVSADKVYKAYNNAYRYLNEESDWSFFPVSGNDEMAVIGMGNVAADVTRVLLNQHLKGTSINPKFYDALQLHAPSVIHVVGTETPDHIRISLNQLENLAAKNVWMTAYFDTVDENQLNKTEKALYQFFLKIKDKAPPIQAGQQIHFHFNQTVKSFKQKGDEIECVFTGRLNKPLKIRVKSVIKAIGTVAKPINRVFSVGWSEGQGGSLNSAYDHAVQMVNEIKRGFYKGQFHHLNLPNKDKTLPGEFKSFVSNREQLNILNYLDAGNFIYTPDDFAKAKQFIKVKPVVESKPKFEPIKPVAIDMPLAADVNAVTLVHSKTGEKQVLELSDMTLLEAMKKSNPSVSCACGGELVCGDCRGKMIKPPVTEMEAPSKKEVALLKVYPDYHFFACSKTVKQLKGAVLEMPAFEEARKNNMS